MLRTKTLTCGWSIMTVQYLSVRYTNVTCSILSILWPGETCVELWLKEIFLVSVRVTCFILL